MLMVSSMRIHNRSGEAALLEGAAWIIALCVLTGVFLPDFRQLTPALLLLATGLLAAPALWWLGVHPARAASGAPRFHALPSAMLASSAALPQPSAAAPGKAFTPVHYPPEPLLSEQLRALGSWQFEKIVELVFQELGFKIVHLPDTGWNGADGEGLDFVVESTAEKYGVQFHHWRQWNVDARPMREFLASLMDHRLQRGIFISLAGVSAEARALAEHHGLQIWTESEIIGMLVESGLMYDHRVSELLCRETGPVTR